MAGLTREQEYALNVALTQDAWCRRALVDVLAPGGGEITLAAVPGRVRDLLGLADSGTMTPRDLRRSAIALWGGSPGIPGRSLRGPQPGDYRLRAERWARRHLRLCVNCGHPTEEQPRDCSGPARGSYERVEPNALRCGRCVGTVGVASAAAKEVARVDAQLRLLQPYRYR